MARAANLSMALADVCPSSKLLHVQSCFCWWCAWAVENVLSLAWPGHFGVVASGGKAAGSLPAMAIGCRSARVRTTIFQGDVQMLFERLLGAA